MNNLVVAITGASGSVYAVRLLDVLLSAGHRVHVTISAAAVQVFKHELGVDVDLNDFDAAALWSTHRRAVAPDALGRLVYHHFQDYTAGIASGSYLTGGMVICPCSMGTLASLASGSATNLIHRAADVHLKERRRLIVVPRETPLSSIQLDNMKRLADAGVVILPAMPAFYQQPTTLDDLVDFIVGRICDQLGVTHQLFRRWGES